MVTANPSRLLGLAVDAGHERLAAGVTADLSLFRVSADGEIEVTATVVAGEVVHRA